MNNINISKNKKYVSNINYPLISFIIPTLNSSRTIKNCLDSIFNQTYINIEVIIIDSYSIDDTIKIASNYNVKIYYSNKSYSQCRQLGVNISKGQIVACFDSDIILPHKNWLYNSVKKLLNNPEIHTIWPIQIPPENSTALQKAYLFEQWGIIKYRADKKIGIMGEVMH